jgi:Ran GTPase-activating protein (RanGAP) involved in mRNA processing and transport
VPGRWLAKVLDGADEPRLALARTLDHVRMNEPARSARLSWTKTPRLRRLTTVRLHDEAFGDDGARSLAESTTLGALTELSIGAHIGPEGAATLLSSPRVRGLRTIGLNRNRIGAVGIAALTSTCDHPALEALYFGRNALDDAALRVLATLHAPRLTRLDLDFNAFGEAGLKALSTSAFFAPVRELNLSNNKLTRESCAILAASPHLAELRVLFLHNCSLTDECLAVLLASPFLRALRNLAVSENQLGMASFRTLADCTALDGLYELDVCHNRVDPQEVEACLRAAPHLGKLNRLCV